MTWMCHVGEHKWVSSAALAIFLQTGVIFFLKICSLKWVSKHFHVKTISTSCIVYGLIILPNQQHRNLTFFRELDGTSFYNKEKCLLRKRYQCFNCPCGASLQYRLWSRCQKHVTPAFSYCVRFWKETFLLKKGNWVRALLAPRVWGHLCCCFGRWCAVRFHLMGRCVLSGALTFWCLVASQPWEPQCFCSNFPHEAVCADPWGQALLVSTDAGVLLVDG